QQGLRQVRTEAMVEEGELAVRMGLNTGLVVVGKIGDNLRMDYTAVGDTTNLAARLQQMAPAEAIWAAEGTYHTAGAAFAWQPLGPLEVRGKAAPVPVYALCGQRALRSRFEVLAQRGLTRFVGRYPELQQLLAAWDRAEQGEGQVVSVLGEAGIGKSRLLYEFKAQLAQEDVPCLEGSCFAYGDSISYLPFLEIVQGFCGLEGRETEAEAKRQIAQRLAPSRWTQQRWCRICTTCWPCPWTTPCSPGSRRNSCASAPWRRSRRWFWPPPVTAPWCSFWKMCTGSTKPPRRFWRLWWRP